MHEFLVDVFMNTLLFVCLGSWGLGVLARKHPRTARLAARGAFHLFKSFLR